MKLDAAGFNLTSSLVEPLTQFKEAIERSYASKRSSFEESDGSSSEESDEPEGSTPEETAALAIDHWISTRSLTWRSFLSVLRGLSIIWW